MGPLIIMYHHKGGNMSTIVFPFWPGQLPHLMPFHWKGKKEIAPYYLFEIIIGQAQAKQGCQVAHPPPKREVSRAGFVAAAPSPSPPSPFHGGVVRRRRVARLEGLALATGALLSFGGPGGAGG